MADTKDKSIETKESTEVRNRKIRLWVYRVIALLGLIAIILILLLKPSKCDCGCDACKNGSAGGTSISTTVATTGVEGATNATGAAE